MKSFFKFVFATLFIFCLVLCTIVFIKLAFFEADDASEPSADAVTLDKGDRYNFLVIGRDEASGLSDMMMIVSYDTSSGTVNALGLPRDTYAEYSDTSYRKLNGAVSKLGGEVALCEFLSKTLCVPIDYYVTLDLDAVGEVVDAIGGVEVDVPFDMDYDDPAQNLSIHLKAGKRVLGGDEARQFVRYRAGYVRGDIGRMDAQKIFLAALVREVKSGLSLAEAGNIVLGLRDDVRTNLSFDEMAKLVRGAFSVSSENIRFLTLAGDGATATESGASYYVISRPAAIEIVNEYLGGNASEETFDPTHLFLNEKYPEFGKIYSTYAKYEVYSASDISGGKLGIAHK